MAKNLDFPTFEYLSAAECKMIPNEKFNQDNPLVSFQPRAKQGVVIAALLPPTYCQAAKLHQMCRKEWVENFCISCKSLCHDTILEII